MACCLSSPVTLRTAAMSSAANMVSRVTDVSQWHRAVLLVMTDPQAVAEHEARIGRGFVAPGWADTAAATRRVVIDAVAASRGEAAP